MDNICEEERIQDRLLEIHYQLRDNEEDEDLREERDYLEDELRDMYS